MSSGDHVLRRPILATTKKKQIENVNEEYVARMKWDLFSVSIKAFLTIILTFNFFA